MKEIKIKHWSEDPETIMVCAKCKTEWKLKDSIGCPKCEGNDGGLKWKN